VLGLIGEGREYSGLAPHAIELRVACVLVGAVAGLGHSYFPRKSRSSSSGMNLGSGDSGGAGASGSWGSPAPQLAAAQPAGGGSGGGFHFPSLDLNMDFDDGFWILLVLGLLIVVLACAGGYLIWAAPQILPDLALNALFAGSVTGAAKRAQTRGWMVSVFRATYVPLLLILAVTTGLAVVVHHSCPGAEKLSTALACPEEMQPPR
jgi:hypothetical protein